MFAPLSAMANPREATPLRDSSAEGTSYVFAIFETATDYPTVIFALPVVPFFVVTTITPLAAREP